MQNLASLKDAVYKFWIIHFYYLQPAFYGSQNRSSLFSTHTRSLQDIYNPTYTSKWFTLHVDEYHMFRLEHFVGRINIWVFMRPVGILCVQILKGAKRLLC